MKIAEQQPIIGWGGVAREMFENNENCKVIDVKEIDSSGLFNTKKKQKKKTKKTGKLEEEIIGEINESEKRKKINKEGVEYREKRKKSKKRVLKEKDREVSRGERQENIKGRNV